MRLVIILLCLPAWAAAGPWLRAPETHFLSISTEMDPMVVPANPYTAVYYEYGLSPKVTLGFDGGLDANGVGKALVFARTQLGANRGPHRLSAEFAFGAISDGQDISPVVRPGVSWGRGFSLGQQSGWWALDATYAYRPKDNSHWPKVEGTIGWAAHDRVKLLMQATAESPNGNAVIVSWTPSVAVRLSKQTHLVFGAVIYNRLPNTLKIGIWQEF